MLSFTYEYLFLSIPVNINCVYGVGESGLSPARKASWAFC